MMFRIHKIDHDGFSVLFFPDSLSIIKTDPKLAYFYIQVAKSADEEEFNHYLRSIAHLYPEICKRSRQEYSASQDFSREDIPSDFSTLILHVSNDCNMRCAYCFANHGVYQSSPGMMSEETAIRAVSLYYSHFRHIHEIKFFGGEPLMNISAIKAVCAYLFDKAERGEIENLPRLKIITNGTIFNQEILDAVTRYGIQVVFSIDGPPEIHDSQRYFMKRRPSYGVITENLKKWKSSTQGKQPCSIETTYSNAHRNAGWSIARVVRFLYDEFDLKEGQVNVSMVNLSPTHPLSLKNIPEIWLEYAHDIVQNKKNDNRFDGDIKMMGYIYSLINRKRTSSVICSAGGRWAAVSAQGDIYPCLMFMDNLPFHMGNVHDTATFHGEKFQRISNMFQQCRPNESSPCLQCFANQVCRKCAGINHFLTGNIGVQDSGICEAVRGTIETLACGIADGILK